MRLYGIAEIAAEIGERRQTVAQWHRRGKLPAPSAELSMGPVWTHEDLAEWLAKTQEVITMTEFRLDPMERTGLLTVDHSASPLAPMTPYLELDTQDRTIRVLHRHQSEQSSVLVSVYHGLDLWWRVSLSADARLLSEAINEGQLDALLSRICNGTERVWDGHNHVGRKTEDAADAVDEVQTWLDGWGDTLPDGGGLWEAGDWFVDGASSVDGLTAATTDEDLTALAESLEQQALADSVVLAGTEECLRRFREQLQDQALESGQYVRCDTCGAWAHYDTLRVEHGNDLGGWVTISEGPECYCPEHRPEDMRPGRYDLQEQAEAE